MDGTRNFVSTTMVASSPPATELMEAFRGPRLKVKRARLHMRDLHATIEASNPPEVRMVQVPDQPVRTAFICKLVRPLSESLPLILGDAVHNLRAALDLLICDSERYLGNEEYEHIYFPFFETEEELERQLIRHGKLKKMSEIVKNQVRASRPYRNGNTALWKLNALDIADKHKIIIPTYAAALASFRSAGEDRKFHESLASSKDKPGILFPIFDQGLLKIPHPEEVEFHIMQDSVRPMFAHGSPFHGELIFETIEYLAQQVDLLIDQFEATLDIHAHPDG